MSRLPEEVQNIIRQNEQENSPVDLEQLLQLAKDRLQIKPLDSKEFLEKIKSNELSVDSEGGLVVLPQKEFTLKIMQMNQEPLIVNVTSHPIIASPE